MHIYTLTQTRNKHGEVFDQAQIEPVLITKQQRPSHVIISVQAYQYLIQRIEELEDLQLGQAAHTAQSESKLVGSEAFTQALEAIANA